MITTYKQLFVCGQAQVAVTIERELPMWTAIHKGVTDVRLLDNDIGLP